MAAAISFVFNNQTYLFDPGAAKLTSAPVANKCEDPTFDATADKLLAIKERVEIARQLPVRVLAELALVVNSFVQANDEPRSRPLWGSSTKSIKIGHLRSFHQNLSRQVSAREGADRGMVIVRLREIAAPNCMDALVQLTELLLTTTDTVAKEVTTEKAKQATHEKWVQVLLQDPNSLHQALSKLMHLDPELQWLKTYVSNTKVDDTLTFCRKALKEIYDTPGTHSPFARYNLHMLLFAFDMIECVTKPRLISLQRLWAAALLVWGLQVSLQKGIEISVFIDDLFTMVEIADNQACKLLLDYLKETALQWKHPQATTILEKGICELAKYEERFDWLQAIITCNLPRDIMERFCGPICAVKHSPAVSKVRPRYEQLLRAESAAVSISKFECLQSAYYICHQLDRSSMRCRVIKKQSCVPRSFQYDGHTGHVSVLLKEKTQKGPPLLFDTGTNKKVTGAIDLPPDCSKDPLELAQAVNKDIRGKTFTTAEMVQEYREEAEKHMRFYGTGQRGIWPIINKAEVYEKVKTCQAEKVTIPKFSVLYPKGRNLFKLIFDDGVVFSPEQYLFIFDELTEGLHSVHAKGSIHGDVKPFNILLRMVLGQIKLVGLSDFDQSHVPHTQKAPKHYNSGIYGTRIFTPPEMIEGKNCNCNLFLAEMFAFGLSLWVLLRREQFAWADYLKNNTWDKISLEALHSLIRKSAEQRRLDLLKLKKRDLMEELELFALNMVRIVPDERSTTQRGLEELSAIKAKFSFKP